MEPFRTLVGLPATGPWPEQFSATGHGTHREGFVVEFNPGTSSSWVGNFQRGLTDYDAVVLHPNGQSVVIIASGQGYLIDPKDRRLVGLLGSQLQNATVIPEAKTIIINNGIWLEGHGESGVLWRSRRISWDGIWDLREDDGRLYGKCWDAANDTEASFSIDIRTGDLVGGVYPEPHDLKP
jgi:hypothetical protein